MVDYWTSRELLLARGANPEGQWHPFLKHLQVGGCLCGVLSCRAIKVVSWRRMHAGVGLSEQW